LNTDVTPHILVARIPGAARLLHMAGKISSERLKQHRKGIFRQVHYLDLRRRLPYENDCFSCAFCSHVLEHLTHPVARHCAKEVYRVLSPGGVFRIAVPDLDRVVSDYDPESPDGFLWEIFEPSDGKSKNSHHWHYNETSLRKLLLESGFSSASRTAYRAGRCPDLQDIDIRPESLFMEAIK
jgi:predicted SAM-dependent methyltransferase